MATKRRSSAHDVWYDARRWSLYQHGSDNTETAQTLIRRTSSAVWQERPQTPEGWTVFLAIVASSIFGYELQLQQQLTCPPFVFLQDDQDNEPMQAIYQRLTKHARSILKQSIRPSLFVGTRSALSTGLAVVIGHPHKQSNRHLRFREIVILPRDGAQLALEFEAPVGLGLSKQQLLKGPIDTPVVLILHGLNNDASASYIQSLQRTLTNRGHIAIGMNFRGCGGVALSNPRPYTGAYTGDLRSVVHILQGRLASDQSLFLVGNSLGANLVTKYLGEEGLSGTLPSCVRGGVSLANPLHIHSKNHNFFPMAQLMAWGVKLDLLSHWRTWKQTLGYADFRNAILGILKASTIDQVDEAMSHVILRNEPRYPFAVRIGYQHVEDYWEDASSYRVVQHVSVPLLQIIAGDDPVVYHTFQNKLAHCSRNPNVMSVETKCGGHLGWQESSPPSKDNDASGFRPTWAGRATADFIDAILHVDPQQQSTAQRKDESFSMAGWEMPPPQPSKRQQVPVIQSKL